MDRTVIDVRPPEPEPERTAVDRVKLGPGLRIEQYELIRELGRGGMGQVYLARDTRLGRRVAMKFLAASSSRVAQRFLIEARATAQCQHENIVVIHGVDEYLGLPYMVLEYVEGVPLKKLISDRRLPAARAVELIVPVVRALARAHEANIVHRDLKPDNIVITAAGTVKVLDFGIASFGAPDDRGVVGTLPYMSPEQLGTDDVDHRSDLWAVGIVLFEMLAGHHPLAPVSDGRLFGAAAALDEPMPSIGDVVPGLPDRLVAIVDRCLAKRKSARYASASELAADLEPLAPGRRGRRLADDESPYPGLTAFQETDADRFFGRTQDIALVAAKLREQPLVGLVGPSGAGKSSLVRAGVVPALKASGDPWEVLVLRPGRHPLGALANALEALRDARDSEPLIGAEDLAATLRAEPGAFGARLRARARRRRSQILVFVDQHEELYTLVADPAERHAFTRCLAGAGDDPSGPLRVIVSMRSDFLDRAAEDRAFVDELTRGLVFLPPPSRSGLEAALTQPLELVGYTFEPGIVDDMLEALATTPGALPLLQFTAARLWETRDPQRRVLSRQAYVALGGVGGALATHADALYASLTPHDQRTVRALLVRLVTPERTRAVVDVRELRDLAPDVDRVIGLLVEARLLVVQSRGGEDGPAVELVHESLLKSWPALRRWLDDNHEDAAFLAELRAAARQWDHKGRPQGLLWRGEAMEEARLWRARYQGELPARERAFLDAVLALATRATRLRRRLVIGAFTFLLALVVAAAAALVSIRDAEQRARHAAERARRNEATATEAKERALEAETAARTQAVLAEQRAATIARQLAELEAAQAARERALGQVRSKTAELAAKQQALHAAREAEARARAAAREEEERRAANRKKITSDLK